MFRKDIQEFYIKNYIENIYIVKRHHADGNVEEKKSSVLYKNIDQFVRVLIQIRKYDKEFKKIYLKKDGADVSANLQEYLDFYVGQFGHKFHSFILEYKNSLIKDDPKHHYIIKKLTKNDIEKVAKNSYARVMFMCDSAKYLLYYIKKSIAKFTEINESFVKLLMSYLRVSVNPLNLIAHVYFNGYRSVPCLNQANKKNVPKGISENGQNQERKKMSPIKDNPVIDLPPKDHFFCNELCQFVCAYGEYIIKHTITNSYVELLNAHEIIKSKLSVYESAKRHIRRHIVERICSYVHFKKYNLSAQFDEDTIFNTYEGDLIKYQKIFRRFTQVGSGYKNVSMSHRDCSYIYELVLAVYFVKKCLFHLNENIDAVLQIALYTLYRSAKVIIIYLYFNLPRHMAHYFLNVYLLFFKNKKKNSEGQSRGNKTAQIMNKMRRTYRNVLQYVAKQEKGSRGSEEYIQDGMPPGEPPYEVTSLGGKIKMSEKKRYSKILNLLYFEMDDYDKRWANGNSKQVKKFVRLHINGSVIQLKYNYEVLLRRKKKCKNKTPTKMDSAKVVIGTQPMTNENGTVSNPKKRKNFIHPDRIEYMKRYAPIYRTKCGGNSRRGKSAHQNRGVYVKTNTVNYSIHNRVIYNYRGDDIYSRKGKKSDKEREMTLYKSSSSSEKHIIGKLFHCVLKNLQKGNQLIPSNIPEMNGMDSFEEDAVRKKNESNDYEDSHFSGPSEEVSKVEESITCPLRTILNEHEKGGETPDSCYLSRDGSIGSEAKMKCEVLSERTLDKNKSEVNSVETMNSKEMNLESEEVTEEIGSQDGGATPPKEVDHTVMPHEEEIEYAQVDSSMGKTHSSVENSPAESRDKCSQKEEVNEEIQSGEISTPEKIPDEVENIESGEKADESPRQGSKEEGHTVKDAFYKESPEEEKKNDNSRGTCSSKNITHTILELRGGRKRMGKGKYKKFFSSDSYTTDGSSDDYNPRTIKNERQRMKRRQAKAKDKRKVRTRTTAKTTAKVRTRTTAKTTAKVRTRTTAKTTAKVRTRTTAKTTAKVRTRTTAKTTAKVRTRTTAKTTAKVSTRTTAKTKAKVSTRTTAKTTAKVSTRTTAKTTAKVSTRTTAKTKGKEKSNEQTKGEEDGRESREGDTKQTPKTHSSKTKKRKRSQLTDEETVKKKIGKSNHLSSYPSKRNELLEGEEKSSTTESVTRKQSKEEETGTSTEGYGVATNGEHLADEHKRGLEKESPMSEGKPRTEEDTAMPGSARKLIFNVSLNGSEGGEECTPYKYEFDGKNNWDSIVTKGKTSISGDHRDHESSLLLCEDNPLWKEVDESQNVEDANRKNKKIDIPADKRLDELLRIDTDIHQFDMPFICTREVYINERVCDIVKDSEERLKLIVIHLFNYYIIGGIFLIDPYNSAQKERYRNFTNIQENINDIEHTKIFKYSSHELLVGSIRKNSKISLLGGRNSKRVMIFMNRQGKGLNGATYKCTINGALHACKIQHRLYLAKKEIFFSYILKTRKMLKYRKYSEQYKRSLSMECNTTDVISEYSRTERGENSRSWGGEVFFEVYAKGNLYMFPDELHYKVDKAERSWDKSARGKESARWGVKRKTNKGGKKGDKQGEIREAKHNVEGKSGEPSEEKGEHNNERKEQGQGDERSEEKGEHNNERKEQGKGDERSEEKGEHNNERKEQGKGDERSEEKGEHNNERKEEGQGEGQSEQRISERGTSLLIMGTQKHVTSLNELINTFIRKGHHSINEELVLFIVYHLIVSLLQLHVLDVLHGDVKIDNILVSKDEELLLRMERSGENSPGEPAITSKEEMKGESTRESKPNKKGNNGNSVSGGSSRSSSSIRRTHGSSNSFLYEYMHNGQLASNPNTFLRNKFPLNVFLIDIGRGIDVKNFRNYLFYGEKNCDCYNFLSDAIFTYHIDFIGIAQVASCLLFYKHFGSIKYKYDENIMDQNYTTINNLNLTYITHNNNFTKNSTTQVRKRKMDNPKGNSKSRCKEIESFIKVKERAYTEDEEKQEKGGIDGSVSLEGEKPSGKSSRSPENGALPVEPLQRSISSAVKKQKKSEKGNKQPANRNNPLESIHFIDYSKHIPMDDRYKKKIDGYIDQMKKNNENYYMEREEESKIKNFSVKLLSKRKKYIDFWEIFFHLLLNFCNVYELSSVNYNCKEIGTNSEKANLFHHKVMNKTENYYFDFCKNNWQEVSQGDQPKNGVHMKEKLNGLATTNDNLYPDGGKGECSSGDSHNNSAVRNIHNTDEAKQEVGNLLHHDNTTTDDGSHACSIQNGRCDEAEEALEKQSRKDTHEGPQKEINHQVGKAKSEREITKGIILHKQNEQRNGDKNRNNSKYFFIKNSISNLKNIKRKMHEVKHKIEREKFESSNKEKNDSYNLPDTVENVNLKRKMIFFENEENRQKCRKLNDQKYYAKECRANDTKRLTRYVNKLMKKKAIFVLLFLKRAIEKIFDDDKSRQETLLSELKNAAAFF
ncbi:conserved Plasmodium protein, unknown function [Plasmodium knowlesi strain H]|uniref:Protein kinase domain-containing protein n=3 Tax=Plasmodium knowlesi TaxID=5850 RepID=A0A5K1U5B8_PLAKH|nr:conserved Plasmodium protein, unknown function [Plasmodium knowlesi strain H]OTN64946.1 Uncharacterized protein PKNOH_S120128200 [Plasmodium knowlesi]CAA9988145.1 conserved Plasmodium protein, unknown function [Plasmodium knowlesi strain H]SBO20041.1 conserved Plasmodium protein, unknown function [Plasmodium knowlesi strain H]SBO20786.1 conserved Plasmodium protein, unknown function [Plasmodium knowlesi strain H]VVS77619.1 conserved Plasmodium protein, unknown function [Plasmodium knowlesi |eukprot:XP_002259121.1 hypothetical protein, conserved in Plasmodium species [Plasmodium knowlesi strain H]